MISRHLIPLLAATAAATSCAGRPDIVRGGSGPFMLVDLPQLGLTPVSVTLEPNATCSYDSKGCYLIGEFDDLEPLVPEGGGYNGLSGAPVFGEGGTLVGAFHSVLLPGSAGGPMALRTAASLREGMALGRARGSSLTTARPAGRAFPGIEAGHLVGVFWLWGDLRRGLSGAVSIREGNEIIALAHAAWKGDAGPRLYACVRTPPMAVIPGPGFYDILPGWGEVIGTATYDGLRGVYCLLGPPPPAVQLTVVSEQATRTYWAAKDPLLVLSSLREALTDGLGVIDLELGYVLHLTMTIDGVVEFKHSGAVAGHDALWRVLEAPWASLVVENVHEIEMVELSIRTDR